MASRTFKQVFAATALVGAFGSALAQSTSTTPVPVTGNVPYNGTFAEGSTFSIDQSGKLAYKFDEALGSVAQSLTINYLNNGRNAVMYTFSDFTSAQDLFNTPVVIGGNGTTFQSATLTYVTPVPEPSSHAMVLAGLGLIGTIAIRRRNQNNG